MGVMTVDGGGDIPGVAQDDGGSDAVIGRDGQLG